jgi:predicted  nucleic acid-binding Zn-ribbon protein
LNAIGTEGHEKLRRCPTCGKIFLKTHKMIYCSRTCGMRKYMQKYRKTEKGQQVVGVANRKQYEKRVSKNVGPNVKINRHSRKPKNKET